MSEIEKLIASAVPVRGETKKKLTLWQRFEIALTLVIAASLTISSVEHFLLEDGLFGIYCAVAWLTLLRFEVLVSRF